MKMLHKISSFVALGSYNKRFTIESKEVSIHRVGFEDFYIRTSRVTSLEGFVNLDQISLANPASFISQPANRQQR